MSGYKHCSYWLVFNNYQLSQQANLRHARAQYGMHWHGYIFSRGYSLYFLLLAHLWWFGGLGFWGWGLGLGLMGFEACGVGPAGFFWVGALYINIEE